ncbi:hypothetical protein Ccrd_025462 [Cynara cardunculus var. scolymus]|uniref:PUB 62/63 C-terminal domain-containing protein n=1 Tax=Cynara cardunculus var. scolymus TaxID=59895 RepID=A0A103X4D0_CYNCS|nr:hypothetical protein Ccrd_025462 [Cynara cardunculus var. scolymus]
MGFYMSIQHMQTRCLMTCLNTTRLSSISIQANIEDKVNYGDSMFMDTPRGRGLQFPFSICDRDIIKGNKRTPEHFVGFEAVITTQCMNGCIYSVAWIRIEHSFLTR